MIKVQVTRTADGKFVELTFTSNNLEADQDDMDTIGNAIVDKSVKAFGGYDSDGQLIIKTEVSEV